MIIGKIAVDLIARTGKFQKGFKRGNKILTNFTRTVSGVVTKIGAIGGALAGVAGAGSIALLTKNSMQAIDATGKLSDELGISTERLVGFQHAAKITGTDTEVINQGIRRFTKNLGEASQGIGEGKRGFDMLGLSIDDLMQKSPADALTDVSEALRGVQNPAERAAAAYALFGRKGQELTKFFMLGKDGLEAMQAEAEKLGITFNRLDAARVEEAKDSIARMKAVITGIGNTLAIELSPYIDAAASKFVEMATSGEGMGEKVVKGLQWIVKGLAKVADYFNLAKAAAFTLGSGVDTVISGLLRQFGVAGKAYAKMASYIPGLKNLGKSAGEFFDNLLSKSEQYADQARINSDRAVEAWEDFSSDKAQHKVDKFFESIKAISTEKAKETVKNLRRIQDAATPDMDAMKGGSKRETTFKQVRLNNVALSGTVGMMQQKENQNFRSDQLDKTNDLLEIIAKKVQPVAVLG